MIDKGKTTNQAPGINISELGEILKNKLAVKQESPDVKRRPDQKVVKFIPADRPQPKDDEAEKGFLSCMIMSVDKSEFDSMVSSSSPDMFFNVFYREVYDFIKERGEANLTDILNRFEGKEAEIIEIQTFAPTTAMYGFYLRKLREQLDKRNLVKVSEKIKMKVASGEAASDIIRSVEPTLSALNTENGAVKLSKELNKVAFSNFVYQETIDTKGKRVLKQVPRTINEMLQDLNVRMLGFPKRCGSKLFDIDKDKLTIRFIHNANDLVAWIAEKTKKNVIFSRMMGGINADLLFSSIYNGAEEYNMISGVPHYPLRSDVYYTFKSIPEPTPDAFFFKKLCSYLCPATYVDSLILRLAIATPLFFRPGVARPIFVIDSVDGRGVGKSSTVDVIAHLYGDPLNIESSSPISISPETIKNDYAAATINRRLLSSSARQKRIVKIDNVTGFFKSDLIATLTTEKFVSGMSPYAKGEEARINDLTVYITSNQAHLSGDFVSRSFLLKLKSPDGSLRNWEVEVGRFIEENRLQIISDIIGLLKRNEKPPDNIEYVKKSRYRSWEDGLMIPILENNANDYQLVYDETISRRQESDGELYQSEAIKDAIVEAIRNCYSNYDWSEDKIERCYWINSDVLTFICQKAIPGIGGRDGRGIRHILKDAHISGYLRELKPKPEKFPTTRGVVRKNGMLWDPEDKYESAKISKSDISVKIIKFKDGNIVMDDYQ